MFKPAKVYHATVILKEDKVTDFVNDIHGLGICELKEAETDLSSKYSYELVKSLDDVETRFSFIVNSLEEYQEVIQPGSRLKKLFSPKAPKKHKSIVYSTEEIIEEMEFHLNMIEPKVLERLDRLQKIKEQIQQNEFIISNLSFMPDISTNIFKSSENIKVFLGLITTASIPKIKKQLEEKGISCIKKKDKNQSFFSLFTGYEEKQDVEKILHDIGFQSLDIIYGDKSPSETTSSLKEEITKFKNEEKRIKGFLTKIQRVYEKKFILLSEELKIAKQKILALQNFKTTQAFSVLEAWVPKKDFGRLHGLVKSTSKQYYIEIDEKDDAPTLLENPKLVKPFEMITELYSPPKYRDIDPTPILAVTFTLFFGFMLTDVAYGLALLAIGWIMYNGIGKIKENMKKTATLLIMFGISTAIMGIVFGSYFGNFFQEIGINLPVPIDSMREVMLTLSIALALGALHLISGLVIGIYENVQKGKVKDALAKQGVWIVFMIGIVFILLKLNTFGLIALGIAVAMQMFFSFLEGGPIPSLLSVFGFSGFIGDLFSYARLMALAIGTAGIALAVNFMVFMVIDLIPWVGWVLGAVIFLIGHVFNIAMNGLGAFIHSTRLHFLEFFTKFYDGGGITYKPFIAERQNTFVKPEGGT